MAEADLTNIAAASIATPAAGVTAFFADPNKRFCSKDDAALLKRLTPLTNFSTVAQAPAAATKTYIAGSNLLCPSDARLQIGTMYRWRFNMTKTAAGLAASTFEVVFGTLGTTGDTTRLTFVKPAGTAVVDEAWVDIIVTVRGPLSAVGVVVGQFIMSHGLQITGHAIIPIVCLNAVSAGFDVTVASLIAGICITSGAADAITIQLVQSEALNL